MAETLGSLIDKLIIKRIRLTHIKGKTPKTKKAIKIVASQIAILSEEIDEFIKKALKGKVVLREQKVKLYKNPPSKMKLQSTKKLGTLIDLLSRINSKQWELEDQIRVPGISYKEVARLKREIDLSNKNRNDTIDRIDELLEQRVKQCAQ